MRRRWVLPALPVPLLDDLWIRLQEHDAYAHRHQPQRPTDQIYIPAHLVKPPAEAQYALDQSGLDEYAVVLHSLDRRHLLGGAVVHAEHCLETWVILHEHHQFGDLV